MFAIVFPVQLFAPMLSPAGLTALFIMLFPLLLRRGTIANRAALGGLAIQISESLKKAVRRMRAQQFDNPVWVKDVREIGKELVQLQKQVSGLTPVPRWKDRHSTLLLSIKHLSHAGTLIRNAMDVAEQGKQKEADSLLDTAIAEIGEGAKYIDYVVELAED